MLKDRRAGLPPCGIAHGSPPPTRLSSTRRLTVQPQRRNVRAHTMVGNRHRAPSRRLPHDHRPPHRRHPDCAGCIGNVRDSHSQYRDESGSVWTNLDKPEHLHRQFSAQSTLFCPLRPIFPSNRPIRLNCPRRLYTASHDAVCAWGSRTAGYRPRRARGLMRGRRPQMVPAAASPSSSDPCSDHRSTPNG